MSVKVYVENVEWDEQSFDTEEEALLWASFMQDSGFKVRIGS